MFSKIRARISSAHLMAAMALFLALGGTALAVKKNSIGTKQLKDNAVKERKLATAAVTTAKIADGAVNGAKVDESSLGKVPAAANADAAATAAKADDSTLFAGRSIAKVRGLAVGVSDSSSQGLDSTSFESVMGGPIAIPAGGADLIVQASVELVNNVAGQHGAQCELRSDGVDISQTYTTTLTAGGISQVISLTGFANDLPETGLVDPENVEVFCQGSIGDDDVAFTEGNLVIQRVPIGS
jgi:hypothetical protein